MTSERSMVDSKELHVTSLRHPIASHVRRMIFSGQLKPMRRINQVHLAEELGTSPVPVREALASLQREGFVTHRPQKGFRVADISKEDIVDHFCMLEFASGLIAERAARRLEQDDLDALSANIIESTVDPEQRSRVHDEFHRTVNRGAGSRRLAYLVAMLSDGFPMELYANIPTWGEATNRSHAEMLAAFKKRDAESAKMIMERHVRQNCQFAISYLEDQGFWGQGDDG